MSPIGEEMPIALNKIGDSRRPRRTIPVIRYIAAVSFDRLVIVSRKEGLVYCLTPEHVRLNSC